MSEANGGPALAEVVEKTSLPIPYSSLMLNHGYLDTNTATHDYPGSGTDQDPYIVGWTADDPRNPLLFNDARKWLWTLLVALANMAVALATSAYTAPARELKEDFGISQEVFELGLSLFVLGFAVGPMFWGPLSELYGRQIVFVGTVSRHALSLLALPYGPPNTLDAVRRPDRFQRWMCCSSEYRRPAHHESPGWSVWIVALDQRRWCRSRYLASPSTWARPCCLLISATVWTGRRSHSRRLPWRKLWVALGARLSVS